MIEGALERHDVRPSGLSCGEVEFAAAYSDDPVDRASRVDAGLPGGPRFPASWAADNGEFALDIASAHLTPMSSAGGSIPS